MLKFILPLVILFTTNAFAGIHKGDTLHFKSISLTDLPSIPEKTVNFEQGAVEMLSYMRSLKLWRIQHHHTIISVRFWLMELEVVKVDILCNSNKQVSEAMANRLIDDLATVFNVPRLSFALGQYENIEAEENSSCSVRFSSWQAK